MNAIGRWKVTLQTPMGPQEMQLQIKTLGQGFTGRIESSMGAHDVSGTVSGHSLSWVMNVTKPIPVKVTFNAMVDGDTMTGSAKAGFLGKAALTGQRLSENDVTATAAAPAPLEGLLTAGRIDPLFREPYVDINELRSDPVPHRYVHGGFKGTDARFSFYFPAKADYQGRFFHNTYPLAVSEDIGPFPIAFEVATGNLAFTLASGAYYVQTNLGGKDRMPPADPTIGAYRVNAAAAKYSRVVAAELFGSHRPFGYLFGGSGGSYQVMGCAENTSGIWDGFVPFVMAVPNAIPSMFTARMHALRVLRKHNRFPGIMDAISPGGSDDPYAGLDEEERAALKEVTRLGFPLRGWWNHDTMNSGYFAHVAGVVPLLDPSYLEDFWTQPGYLGSDPQASVRSERFQFDTTVARVIEGFQTQVELSRVPDRDFADSHLVITGGALAGRSAPLADINGRICSFSVSADPAVVNGIRAGESVRLDNAWALALQTYQRHQVPGPDMVGWNQFRDQDGTPLYPQRELLVGPLAAAGTAGSVPEGRIHGKMLALECLMDIDAMPWQADWYRSKVKQALGQRFHDNFVLWYIDHAQHDNPATMKAHAHAVSFEGALQQALRDLSAWVEAGTRPSDTRYEVIDAQVSLPAAAAERGGIQPVIDLKADSGMRAEVTIDQIVAFNATIEVPPGAGKVVKAEWDFEGLGNYPVPASVETPQASIHLSARHAYSKPGIYFPVLRVTSQREGDPQTAFGRIHNIARVRVVVR